MKQNLRSFWEFLKGMRREGSISKNSVSIFQTGELERAIDRMFPKHNRSSEIQCGNSLCFFPQSFFRKFSRKSLKSAHVTRVSGKEVAFSDSFLLFSDDFVHFPATTNVQSTFGGILRTTARQD